jgi:hypothetical protein
MRGEARLDSWNISSRESLELDTLELDTGGARITFDPINFTLFSLSALFFCNYECLISLFSQTGIDSDWRSWNNKGGPTS